MTSFRFKNVHIEAMGTHFPEEIVSSIELEARIEGAYKRLGIPFGTLEKLSGVKTRRVWDKGFAPSKAATGAVLEALKGVKFPLNEIGSLISCSVTRDYFEPATATLIHRNLDLHELSLAFDISDACIGFSDGLLMTANLIESGVIRAGIVVSGENPATMIESTVHHVNTRTDLSRDDLIKVLPTFTLGCGAACYVLCHKDLASTTHRIAGAGCRSASQFNHLCVGDKDYGILDPGIMPLMMTESSTLIPTAAKLGGRTWPLASEALGWAESDLDHIFCHQVGKQVNEAFYKEIGLPMEKEFTIYRDYGNMVSAALPSCFFFGVDTKPVKQGEKSLLLAFGSGLNARFIGIEW